MATACHVAFPGCPYDSNWFPKMPNSYYFLNNHFFCLSISFSSCLFPMSIIILVLEPAAVAVTATASPSFEKD